MSCRLSNHWPREGLEERAFWWEGIIMKALRPVSLWDGETESGLRSEALDPSCDHWHTSAKQLDKVRSSVQGHGRKWSWGPHRDPTRDDSLINTGHSRAELTGCKCHPRFWKHHPLTWLLQDPHVPIHSILFSDLRYHCHLACSRRLLVFSSL